MRVTEDEKPMLLCLGGGSGAATTGRVEHSGGLLRRRRLHGTERTSVLELFTFSGDVYPRSDNVGLEREGRMSRDERWLVGDGSGVIRIKSARESVTV